jgi:hypothetical protein
MPISDVRCFVWGYNTKQRASAPPQIVETLTWVARNSAMVSVLSEPATARRVLDAATSLLNGKAAAASTARRNRTILVSLGLSPRVSQV